MVEFQKSGQHLQMQWALLIASLYLFLVLSKEHLCIAFAHSICAFQLLMALGLEQWAFAHCSLQMQRVNAKNPAHCIIANNDLVGLEQGAFAQCIGSGAMSICSLSICSLLKNEQMQWALLIASLYLFLVLSKEHLCIAFAHCICSFRLLIPLGLEQWALHLLIPFAHCICSLHLPIPFAHCICSLYWIWSNEHLPIAQGLFHFDQKKPSPPGGFSYLLCSLIKNRE